MNDPKPSEARPSLPPVAELVPHEPPMLLIDELLEWSPDAARVRAKVRAGGPFVVDGRMPASFCLEYMAQAIAAAMGMASRQRGEAAGLGVLLGSRELSLSLDSLAVGDALEITVERVYADDKLASYACRLTRGGLTRGDEQQVAAATINVMATNPEELS